jgi:gluconolactonase
MTVDERGNLYVATPAGIQIADQAGRVMAILNRAHGKRVSNVCLGGKDLSVMYVTSGDKVFRRQMRAKGVLSGLQAPVKPRKPFL